jgi:hypothetical protein
MGHTASSRRSRLTVSYTRVSRCGPDAERLWQRCELRHRLVLVMPAHGRCIRLTTAIDRIYH